jgi:hypothetical protein
MTPNDTPDDRTAYDLFWDSVEDPIPGPRPAEWTDAGAG